MSLISSSDARPSAYVSRMYSIREVGTELFRESLALLGSWPVCRAQEVVPYTRSVFDGEFFTVSGMICGSRAAILRMAACTGACPLRRLGLGQFVIVTH